MKSKVHKMSLLVDKANREWVEDWANDHCPYLNGEPNLSEAIRLAVELGRLIDTSPELTDIINKEFAGDYRMLVKRAIQDYHETYKELQDANTTEN